MPGMTATFQADFTSFEVACKQAQNSLKGVDADAQAVGATFDKIGATAGAGFGSLGQAVDKVKPGELTKQFQAFDSVLTSVGVRIAPEVRALGELGAAASKTAGELGAFGSAGLVVGTAIGAWKLGRAVADFLELDDAIAQTTAKLLGFGDVAAQVAGANADKLAAASKAAGRPITDLAEATRVLADGLLTVKSPADQSAQAIAAWHQSIANVKAAGNLDALNADLKSQAFSLAELATRYHTTVDAVQLYQREQATASATQKALTAEMRAYNDAIAELLVAGPGWEKVLAGINTETVLAVKAYLEAGASQTALAKAYNLSATQVQAVARFTKEQTEAQKQSNAQVDAMTTLWDEFDATRIANSTTVLQKQLSDLASWVTANKQAAIDAKIESADLATARDAVAEQRKQSLLVDYDALKQASSDFYRQTLEDAAARASATYEYAAAAASGFSATAIAHFRDVAIAAQFAAANWAQSFREAADDAAQSVALTPLPGGIGGPAGSNPAKPFGYSHAPESSVPIYSMPVASQTTVNNTFNVNGSIADLAQKLMDEMTRSMKTGKQYPAN